MYELQVANYENTDIDLWDFNAFKSELQRFLSEYEGVAYTEDMVKIAKKDKSTLNSVKKVIEDARKAYKSRCMAPYEAIEPKIKELTGMIESSKSQIDNVVKEYERIQKEEKEKKIREYYDQVSGRLGSYAPLLYESLLNPKWMNASTTIAAYKEGIQNAVAAAERDLKAILDLGSPFEKTLIDVYIDTVSMEAVEEKNAELTRAMDAAKFSETPSAPAAVNPVVPEPEKTEPHEEGTLIRIRASQSQLNKVYDFMKAIGVEYEIL